MRLDRGDILASTVFLSIASVALGAGVAGGWGLTFAITIPGWLVGALAGVVIFAVVGVMGLIVATIVVDVARSPIYQRLVIGVFKDYWWIPLLASLALLFFVSLFFGLWWGIAAGLVTYPLVFAGIYVFAHVAIGTAIGSAAFVRDTYKSAGVPIDGETTK